MGEDGEDGEWDQMYSGYDIGSDSDGNDDDSEYISPWPPRIIGQKGSGVTYLYLSQVSGWGVYFHDFLRLPLASTCS